LKVLSLLIGIVLMISCGSIDKTSSNVYIGGEIVNPTSEYLLLYKNDKVIDSARLDHNNRFKIIFNDLDEGLYNFYHEPEFNYIYLQKGDSLNMRLNTLAFDESLVFSGRGSEVNNFLVELLLQREEEEHQMNAIYDLDPITFDLRIKELRAKKLQLLEAIKNDIDLSNKAIDIVKASIDYNVYVFKEKYPFFHKFNSGKHDHIELPNEFYNYRKTLKINNKDLYFYSPYYSYMKYQLGNLAFLNCRDQCSQPIEKNQILHFNQHKLVVIDSLRIDKRLKDNLFRNVAIQYFIKSRDSKSNMEEFNRSFIKYSSSNEHFDEIEEIYTNISNLQPNKVAPNIELISYEGVNTDLNTLSKNKKLVLYFWSPAYESNFYKIQERVRLLEKKYPEYTFIGISSHDNDYRWRSLIRTSNLSKELQFYTPQLEIQNRLVIDNPYKSIIIHDGRIEDAFANLLTSF